MGNYHAGFGPADEGLSTPKKLVASASSDWNILGFVGTKAEAEAIKERIKEFLGTIKLTLSDEKTLVTHATTQKARFLGYEIHTGHNNDKRARRTSNGNRRSINGTIILGVPNDVIKSWKRKHSKNGKPAARARFISCSDHEIIMMYGIELRGLVNYYQLASNIATKLYPVKYVMEQSLIKTLAAKHKRKVTWAYKKYGTTTESGLKAIKTITPNPDNPDKPLTAQFGGLSIETNPRASIIDEVKTLYHKRNELVERLVANECELCGSNEDIRVHHKRQIKDVTKKYKGKPHPPEWAVFMMKRNRKTIVVCQECHRKIHKGEYDGKKVA